MKIKKIFKQSYIRKTKTGKRTRVKSHYQRYAIKERFEFISDEKLELTFDKMIVVKGKAFDAFGGLHGQATIYKDQHRRKWLWKPEALDVSALNELASSQLAQKLRINSPEIIFAKRKGITGVLVRFIESRTLTRTDPRSIKMKNRQKMDEVLPFEAWIVDLDRHGSNYLVDKKQKVWVIDLEQAQWRGRMRPTVLLLLLNLVTSIDDPDVKKVIKRIRSLSEKDIRKVIDFPTKNVKTLSVKQFIKLRERQIEDLLIRRQKNIDQFTQEYITISSGKRLIGR